jgi:xanthine/uracil permease
VSLRYSLDEKPPLVPWLLFGLQWLAIALPSLVIIGQVVAALHFDALSAQVVYLQKLAFVVGVTMFVQVLWGHRLPLVMGPAAVLLVGVLASQGFPPATVYTAVMTGGAAMALVSFLGLFRTLQRLFTVRVVAVVLLLIAFTLTPAIRDLMLYRSGAGDRLGADRRRPALCPALRGFFSPCLGRAAPVRRILARAAPTLFLRHRRDPGVPGLLSRPGHQRSRLHPGPRGHPAAR